MPPHRDLTEAQHTTMNTLRVVGFYYFTDYWDGSKRVVVMHHAHRPYTRAVIDPLGNVNTLPLETYLKELDSK